MYAYVCEYCTKVASYTGFHVKCHITNSSQVKLAQAFKFHMRELSIYTPLKLFSTLSGGKNKTHKTSKREIS